MGDIVDAAVNGDLATVNQLLVEDNDLLNQQDEFDRTSLLGAAYGGHSALVARLLTLGAELELQNDRGLTATHMACAGNNASCLSLLLDTGASLAARTEFDVTPLMLAACLGSVDCVALLVARGGATLDVDARRGEENDGDTALHAAVAMNRASITSLLLQAGANPTIRDKHGRTPLDCAQEDGHAQCIALLEPAVAEPQRARTLKARTLIDAAHAIHEARAGNICNHDDDEGDEQQQHRSARRRSPRILRKEQAVAVTPTYLKGRVAAGRELPRVSVVAGGGRGRSEDEEQKKKLVACTEYALEGMVKEVFVELCELLVPKWDRRNV